ncbi:MAG: hypothetical protein AAF619_09430 [Pseudomonadota bacterium]
MNDPFEFSVAISLVTICAFASMFIQERAKRHEHKRIKLIAASEALKKHFEAMKELDSDDTPVEVLESALQFSAFFCNTETPHVIEHLTCEDVAKIDVDLNKEHAFHHAFQEFSRKRPDLAAKFTEASIYGLFAYVQRWPKCSHLFPDMVVEIVAHPATEVDKVYRLTRWADLKASRSVAAHA